MTRGKEDIQIGGVMKESKGSNQGEIQIDRKGERQVERERERERQRQRETERDSGCLENKSV